MKRSVSAIVFLLATAACQSAPTRANEAAPTHGPTVGASAEPKANSPLDPPAASQNTGRQSTEEINTNIVPILRNALLAVNATFDGQMVTDLVPVTICESAIVTPAGRTALRWGMMGNLAARIDGAKQTLQLPAHDPNGHLLSLPENADGDRIISSIGLLVSNCETDPIFQG